MQFLLIVFLLLFSKTLFAQHAGIKNFNVEISKPTIFSDLLDYGKEGLYIGEELQKLEPRVDLKKTKLIGVKLLAKSNGSFSYVYISDAKGQSTRRHLKGNYAQYSSDYDFYHEYYLRPLSAIDGEWFLGIDGIGKVLEVELTVDLHRKNIVIDPVQPIVVKVPLTNYSAEYHNDTYSSTLPIAPYQYSFSEFLGYISKFREDGTVPLYGCKYGKDRYATTKIDCGGGDSTLVKILGYIFEERVSKSLPIYSCRSYLGDFFTATSETCNNNGTNGGVFGYILP